eukprot:274723_1
MDKDLDDGFTEKPYIESSDYPSPRISHPSTCRYKCRSLWMGFVFYSRLSHKEIKRHLFNFILGIVSCTITVFVAATISTIVDNAPFVILKQAENGCGQYDIRITPRNGPYLNYSMITQTLIKHSQSKIAKLSTSRYVFNDTQSLFFTPKCIQTIPDFQINRTDNLYSHQTCEPYFMNQNSGCKAHTSTLSIIDFRTENRMGFGSHFPEELIPSKGEIVVNKKRMKAFDVDVGDYLLLLIDLDNGEQQNLLYSLIRSQPNETEEYRSNAESIAEEGYCSRILIPVQIIGIVDEISFGKFGSNVNTFTFIMSNQYFMEYLHEFSNLKLSSNPIFDGLWSSSILRDLSTHVFFNIPSRIKYYLSLNYDKIQEQFSIHSSNIMYYLGFTQIDISSPIEEEFFKLRYGALFFQLILDIILLTLVILSIMLLYSLLVVSVDTRTFQLGILRMIGMTRRSLIKLLIHQSLTYSLPSWIFGIIISEIAIFYLLSQFSDLVGYHLDPIISLSGIVRATAVGILIPLISSILPIKNALSKNLHNAIDANHASGPEIIEYKIERSEQSAIPTTLLVVGVIMVLFGFCVYYVFPLALITQRLSLVLTMFFALMIALLIGLLLLSFNVQHLIEKGIVLLLFAWWEKRHIPYLVHKNIIAHKQRNQKTSLMYASSLGFIIMISVVYRVNIKSIGMTRLTLIGGTYAVSFDRDNIWRYTDIEQKFKAVIETLTYRWAPLSSLENHHVTAWDLSKIDAAAITMSMISPDYLNVAEKSLFSLTRRRHKPDGIDHELYTAKGSQSAIIGHKLQSLLFLSDEEHNDKIILQFANKHYKMIQALDYSQVYPGYHELSKMYFRSPALGVSIPTTLRWDMLMGESVAEEEEDEASNTTNRHSNNLSLEDAMFHPRRILIKFWHNASTEDVDSVKQYVNEYASHQFDYDDFMMVMKSTNDVMDIVFSVATYISLFLCLFSIISSMYVNIYEQSKEIAALRACGLSKQETYKVYLYEATVLILSSCLMGTVIGAAVGFTMAAQLALYASYPIGFDMPYQLLIIILCASFISAAISVITPLVRLLSKTVSHIMRVNF